jgi:hypothetical protein
MRVYEICEIMLFRISIGKKYWVLTHSPTARICFVTCHKCVSFLSVHWSCCLIVMMFQCNQHLSRNINHFRTICKIYFDFQIKAKNVNNVLVRYDIVWSGNYSLSGCAQKIRLLSICRLLNFRFHFFFFTMTISVSGPYPNRRIINVRVFRSIARSVYYPSLLVWGIYCKTKLMSTAAAAEP